MDVESSNSYASEPTDFGSVDGSTWNQLPNRFVARSAISVALSTLLVGLPVLAGIGWVVGWSYSIEQDVWMKFVVGGWICLLLVRVVGRSLEVPKRRFLLRTLDFSLRTGLIGRTELVLPFSRLQEVSTSSRVLDRLFRLSSLELTQVSGTETIKGLDVDVASKLREYIGHRVVHVSRVHPIDQDGVCQADIVCDEQPTDSSLENELTSVGSLEDDFEPQWNRFKCLGRELFSRIGTILVMPFFLAILGLILYGWFWKDLSLVWFLILAWIVISLRTLIYPIFEVPRRGYVLREFDISVKQGVIGKTRTIVPITRIQDVATSSGFVDRRFGLSSLSIQTAGSSTSLEGLGKTDAEDLRVQILDRVREIGGELSHPEETTSNATSQDEQAK